MAERLQKVLSQWGIASRRRAEAMITAGRVRVNGAPAKLGDKVDPEVDRIECDGRLLRPSAQPEKVYLLLHKPLGTVSTCSDPQGRRTVIDHLPRRYHHQGIHPVGRLDVDSSGALLLTNDGQFTHYLTHPSHDVDKVYRVWVTGAPSPQGLKQWRDGVRLDGVKTRAAQVKLLRSQQNPTASLLEVKLKEGRNRQIRRVATQLGYPVERLRRIAIGSIQLGNLPPGEVRALTTAELETLRPGPEAPSPSRPPSPRLQCAMILGC